MRTQKTFTVKRLFGSDKTKVKVIKTSKSIIFYTFINTIKHSKRTKIKRGDSKALFDLLLYTLIRQSDKEDIKTFINK